MRTPDETRITPSNPSRLSTLRQVLPQDRSKSNNDTDAASALQHQLIDNSKQANLLWKNAVLANHAAKISSNPAALYKRKGFHLSALRRMGNLYVKDAEIAPIGIVLSVAFGYRQIHILTHQLDSDVQAEIAPIVSTLLIRKTQLASHGGPR